MTNLCLNGEYIVEADSDETLQLMLWRKNNDKEEVKCIQNKDKGMKNIWNFCVTNEMIVGIGLLSLNFTVVRSFVFRRQISKNMLPQPV